MSDLRIVFMGTPELAATSLRRLLAEPSFQVLAAVSQPDRPKGRDLKLQATPVKEAALRANLPVFQPQRAREDSFVAELRRLAPDLIAVAAYGQILPQAILDIPRLGCLNVHTSLLPKYRGAAPIQRAILNDEPETGVTIMKMDAGLDTGDILLQESSPILRVDDAPSLHDRLATIGADLLVRVIHEYAAGRLSPRPQPAAGVTLAPKIRKEEGLIDWTQPARKIWNQTRGLTPWPGAFTRLGGAQGSLLKIWKTEVLDAAAAPGEVVRAEKAGLVVGCGSGCLLLQVLQREGGRRLNAAEFIAGFPLPPGTRLG